jgi:uncharacterized protein
MSAVNDVFLKAAMILTAIVVMSGAGMAADDDIKTVYHFHNGQGQASMGMRNIQNHLKSEPGAKIVVVANFKGVEAFVFGAQDNTAKAFADWVEELSRQGVDFRVCQHSMNALKITSDKLIANVRIVPSGVAEIARLQSREKFGYIRP